MKSYWIEKKIYLEGQPNGLDLFAKSRAELNLLPLLGSWSGNGVEDSLGVPLLPGL